MTRLFPLLLASLVLISCSSGHYQTKNEGQLPSSDPGSAQQFGSGCILQQPAGRNYRWVADTAWVDSTLRSLSLREKIGQMIVPFTYARYMSDNSNSYDKLSHLVKEFHVGGFVMSIGNVYEEAMLIDRLQKISKIPLLFASDFEYGLGMRLEDAVSFPMNMALGATRDTSLAFKVGHAVGSEARAIGVLQVYAPVSDVNDNPKNPIINVRSFGENPQLVGQMASAWAMGAQDAGVVATAKHFPGHGDTQVDSHTQLPTINYPYSRLDTLELVPFRDDIAAGIKSVMVAHIAFPLFQHETGVPATLSRQITTGMLRDSLGFRGLIVTDALTMGGVTKDYSTAKAAIRAVNAGTDILLMPPDDRIAVDAIVKAVHDGIIKPATIDNAVKEILTVKSELGLEKRRFVDVDNISKIIGSMNHELLAQKAARRSVTIVRNIGNYLPLQYHQPQQLLCLTVADNGDPSIGQRFRNEMAQRCDNIAYAQIDPTSNQMDFDDVYKMAQQADIIVIACYVQWGAGQGTVDFTPPVKDFLNKIAALNKPCIMISFGNPYLLRSIPIVPAYVCAYSSSRYSVNATVQALFGEIDASGKLPVTIPNAADYGEGVMLPKTSLQYASPQEAGFNPAKLDRLDSLMNYWVAKGAFPGAQLLVARHGMITYDKCFGTLDTSLYSRRVQPNTMYDLASLTKVVATTFAAMKLYDEGKLNLDAPVARYLPQFAQNGKSKVTVRNLLVHDSGLPPDPPHFLWETGAIPQNQLQRLLKDPHAFVYADSFGTNFHLAHQAMYDSIYAMPLSYKTGTKMVYSDINFIVLGKVIENITGMPLDQYVEDNFYKPLGMTHTMFNPPSNLWKECAATEYDSAAGYLLQGVVHDENARSLGGVSGHAGLFSTSEDLATYAQLLLNGGVYDGRRYLKASTIDLFTRKQSDLSTRALGWDTKSPENSTAGKYFSPTSYGHLGFTGTMIWIDPVRKLFVILLTNRVCPTRKNEEIQIVRPEVCNAVIEALSGNKQ